MADKQETDERGESREVSEAVRAHEEYFKTKYYLVGSASGGEIEIQSGEHKFPFQCVLPTNLPSSFESNSGHVRYTVKATLDRPWKFDQEAKSPFTVIQPLDLNQELRASEKVQEEMSKTFCCLCCATAPLTVNYSLPVRGYVPGQTMPIKINVENSSSVTVNTVKLVLYKILTFHATSPSNDSKTEKFVVAEVGKGPVEGGATADYEQNLDIPPLPPSNLKNCGIIDLEYNLNVVACVSGWYHRNLSKSTLVFVGSIPLINYQIPSAPPAETTKAEAGWSVPDGVPTSNLYPDLPPPSYEESKNGAKTLWERGESEHIFGLTNHFAPRYPVYNFMPVQ
ncbi:arrestin domain-containing protein 17 isoform X2 [Ptiloglossa arizonensis]